MKDLADRKFKEEPVVFIAHSIIHGLKGLALLPLIGIVVVILGLIIISPVVIVVFVCFVIPGFFFESPSTIMHILGVIYILSVFGVMAIIAIGQS